MYQAVKITDRVYWVGAIDWTLRDFHGYTTGRGSTYNAYLILADKITLIDTVKAGFQHEMLARIASVVDPEKIAYIVSDHSETDHTGALTDTIERVKPEAVFASAMGVKALAGHFHGDLGIRAVKDGETLSLGNATLAFTETRMMHWPDSMFSYLVEEKLLFSQDGFGMHLASEERFADQLPPYVIEYEAAKYFANILMPYASRIVKVLDKVAQSGIELKIIAPDHGPVWRSDTSWILGKYREWIERKPKRKAVIVFDTMWGSTEKMARAICEGLTESGVPVSFLPLRTSNRSDAATEVLDAAALIVGSPTLNDGLLPTVADVLTYLRGLKPKNLLGAVFGSHGWNGTGADEIKKYFDEMKVELVADPLKANWIPDGAALQDCRKLGRQVAEKVKEACDKGT
ncbi:FprA family A-type flavoprotein [bacterium]|nr:FprA family A-type flavoprotein [bacterium]MBU1983605.1 FprA family A-type flavoprotein [bacterium]